MGELPKEIEVEILGRKVVLKQHSSCTHSYYSDDLPLEACRSLAIPRDSWEFYLELDIHHGDHCCIELHVTAIDASPQEAAAKLEATVREHFTDPALVFGFKEGSDGRE